jgi:HEPN domain-containing protein
MDERIKNKIRKIREQYGIPTAEKAVPLFQPGVDESCVANVYPDDDIRALGFKSAADKLVDIALKNPGCGDYLVYSIAYLYRMHIELRLKTIIESAKHIYRKGHELKKLWEEAKPVMKNSSQWFDDQELEAVEEKIEEFCKIDPSSDAWRYSRDYYGDPTLERIQTVDLKHLKQVMDSISTPLEGSYTAIFEDRQGE